jgi:nucleoside phosphorylase
VTSSTPEQEPQDVLDSVTIAIITALPKEFAAVKALIENLDEYFIPGKGAGRRYWVGEVSASHGGKHQVVLCLLPDMGNNSAAIRATLVLEHFPQIQSIIMTGIAGGVPHPDKPDEHVRLGDVVVSDRNGVVQYDLDKETISEIIHRHPPRPPSAVLLEGVRYLEASRIGGKYPWQPFIQQVMNRLEIELPPVSTDTLTASLDQSQVIVHPIDRERKEGQPKLFYGSIASANKLLKNPLKRDALRNKFGVKAVEMEGSGIADATWNYEVGYLVIRGICDYCDSHKGDVWQTYAAVVSAAYTRALLESIPNQKSPEKQVENIDVRSNILLKEKTVIGSGKEVYKPINILILYASQDKKLREEFEDFCLSSLKRAGLVEVWHKGTINPGANSKFEIETYLNKSQLILPLVSKDFVNSYNQRLEGIDWQTDQALQRLSDGKANIIPILISIAYAWEKLPFGHLEPLPSDRRAILGSDSKRSKNQGFHNVAEALEMAIQVMTTSLCKQI